MIRGRDIFNIGLPYAIAIGVGLGLLTSPDQPSGATHANTPSVQTTATPAFPPTGTRPTTHPRVPLTTITTLPAKYAAEVQQHETIYDTAKAACIRRFGAELVFSDPDWIDCLEGHGVNTSEPWGSQ